MAKVVIHNRIRRLRFDCGEMTQAALAARVGCTRQTIVLLEQQRYAPSLALALKIAHVFGQKVDDIFRLDCADDR